MFKIDDEVLWRFFDYIGFARYKEICVPAFTHESENYVFIEWHEQGFWLPKSDILIERSKDGSIVLKVPTWRIKKMRQVSEKVRA